MSEYTPDDEDVEETYVAYEEAFSAEADPRGNYRRWLVAHDKALRRKWTQEATEDVIAHDEALEKALREQVAQEIDHAADATLALGVPDRQQALSIRRGRISGLRQAARIVRGKGQAHE